MLRPDAGELGLWQEYPASSELLQSVLHGERMTGFFAGLLGGAVRGYDFIWLRHQRPSHGVEPHCDVVFMGRGTPDVLTCWTPFGDIPLGGGGLMLLEDSHRQSAVRIADYLAQDVDTYCEQRPERRRRPRRHDALGALGRARARARLGRRDHRERRGAARASGAGAG